MVFPDLMGKDPIMNLSSNKYTQKEKKNTPKNLRGTNTKNEIDALKEVLPPHEKRKENTQIKRETKVSS